VLPHIESQTLVLHGSDDEMAPRLNAHRIAERIPNLRLNIHAAGRHGFFDEFADDLEPVLHALWTRVSMLV